MSEGWGTLCSDHGYVIRKLLRASNERCNFIVEMTREPRMRYDIWQSADRVERERFDPASCLRSQGEAVPCERSWEELTGFRAGLRLRG